MAYQCNCLKRGGGGKKRQCSFSFPVDRDGNATQCNVWADMFMYVRMYVCIYRVHIDVGLMGAVQKKYIRVPIEP